MVGYLTHKYAAVSVADRRVAGVTETSSPPTSNAEFTYIKLLEGFPEPLPGTKFEDGKFIETEESICRRKEERWQQAKDLRQVLTNSGAPTRFGVVDSDEVSLSKLNQVGLGALIAIQQQISDYTIVWTLKDNSTVELTAEEFIQLSKEVSEHISQTHQHFTTVRRRLDEAQTMKELEAIRLLGQHQGE